MKKTIRFDVTIDEANTIFKALSRQPFSEVYELVGKLNTQANEQLRQPGHEEQYYSEKDKSAS